MERAEVVDQAGRWICPAIHEPFNYRVHHIEELKQGIRLVIDVRASIGLTQAGSLGFWTSQSLSSFPPETKTPTETLQTSGRWAEATSRRLIGRQSKVDRSVATKTLIVTNQDETVPISYEDVSVSIHEKMKSHGVQDGHKYIFRSFKATPKFDTNTFKVPTNCKGLVLPPL